MEFNVRVRCKRTEVLIEEVCVEAGTRDEAWEKVLDMCDNRQLYFEGESRILDEEYQRGFISEVIEKDLV